MDFFADAARSVPTITTNKSIISKSVPYNLYSIICYLKSEICTLKSVLL